jgi:hypothetical protein
MLVPFQHVSPKSAAPVNTGEKGQRLNTEVTETEAQSSQALFRIENSEWRAAEPAAPTALDTTYLLTQP